MPKRSIAKKGADRGEGRVAGANAVPTSMLELVEESGHERSIQLIHTEP